MSWKWNKNLGQLLLAVWLIITGLLHFVHVVPLTRRQS
jgi:uncharacterized membrane protein